MSRILPAIVAAVFAAVLFDTPRPMTAQAPSEKPLSPELKLVPGDAAVFAHVDVDRVWKSKLGETFRKMNAPDLTKAIGKMKEIAGITPEDVKTFTFYVPKVKTDGEPPFGIFVTTKKPYDRDKLVAYLKQEAGKEKDGWSEMPGNKYVVAKRVLFDLGDLQSFRVFFQYEKDQKDPPAAGDGVVTPAIKAAASGKPAVLAVAFGNLPDEIRQENIPAEVRPFQPIFFTDAGFLIGDFVKDDVVLDIRFKAENRAKANEAEKSLGALKTLIQTALSFGMKELEKDKEKAGLRIMDLMKDVQATVKAARITNDDNTPSVSLSVKSDVDYAALLEYAFGRAGGADRMMDANNLKQIGLAMHNYASVHNTFPPSAVVGKKGKPMLSWRVMILPYIEQDQLYKKFNLDEPWDSTHNKKVFDENPMPKIFVVPGGTAKLEDKKTHYQGFVGNGAFFDLIQGARFADITDGTSNTAMIVTAKTAVPWSKPDDIEFDPKKDPRDVLLFIKDMCSIAFGDGSVRALKNDLPADTWRALITRAGGEVFTLP